jgi:hypothetical protein
MLLTSDVVIPSYLKILVLEQTCSLCLVVLVGIARRRASARLLSDSVRALHQRLGFGSATQRLVQFGQIV